MRRLARPVMLKPQGPLTFRLFKRKSKMAESSFPSRVDYFARGEGGRRLVVTNLRTRRLILGLSLRLNVDCIDP